MIINHNLSSLNTANAIGKTDIALTKALEKLSSGKRINRASDDAAGLAVSEKMKAQISGMNMAKKNAADGISLVQTAEGGLAEIQSILQRMRELAVQANNGTYNSSDLDNLQKENSELISQIDDIASKTKFNGIDLISSAATSIKIQTGVNSGDTITITTQKADTTTLGVTAAGVNIGSAGNPSTALAAIDGAINTISTARAQFGAYQNRLEHIQTNLTTTSENLTAAESAITDVDMATEMAEYSKLNILSQTGMSVLSQANNKNQSVLKLISQ